MAKAKATPTPTAAPFDGKRQRLLDAAVATFLRYGFRKTSMDEVARAAHISRQGLYLHFATKEDLFAAAARHLLDSSLLGASDALARHTTIEDKLLAAFDEWSGRHAGTFTGEISDLKQAGEHLIGDLIREREDDFIALVTKTIRATGLPAAYKDANISARDLAETLFALASGLKHQVHSREEFVRRFSTAVRALCLPVRSRH